MVRDRARDAPKKAPFAVGSTPRGGQPPTNRRRYNETVAWGVRFTRLGPLQPCKSVYSLVSNSNLILSIYNRKLITT